MVLLWNIRNLVHQFDSNLSHICLTFLCIENTENFSILSRTVCIFLEIALNTGNSLITAATWFNMCLYGLLLVFDSLSLAHNDLLFWFYNPQSWVKTSYKNLHFIFYTALSFLVFWFVSVWCRIILSSLKTKGERVLSCRDKVSSEVMKHSREFRNDSPTRVSCDFFELASIHYKVVLHRLFFMFMIFRVRTVHSYVEFIMPDHTGLNSFSLSFRDNSFLKPSYGLPPFEFDNDLICVDAFH